MLYKNHRVLPKLIHRTATIFAHVLYQTATDDTPVQDADVSCTSTCETARTRKLKHLPKEPAKATTLAQVLPQPPLFTNAPICYLLSSPSKQHRTHRTMPHLRITVLAGPCKPNPEATRPNTKVPVRMRLLQPSPTNSTTHAHPGNYCPALHTSVSAGSFKTIKQQHSTSLHRYSLHHQ